VRSADVLQGFVRCSCLSDAGLYICICSSLLVYQAPKVREGLDLLQVVVYNFTASVLEVLIFSILA
jgi:hypothetical protein